MTDSLDQSMTPTWSDPGSKIKIVDANLRPSEDRFKNVARELLRMAGSRQPVDTLEVQFICKNDLSKPSWDLFERSLRSWPRQVIRTGMNVEFIRLEEIGRERFHDRLILTEFEGAYLPDGLDEEDAPVEGGGRATLLRQPDYTRIWDVLRKDGSDFFI